MPILAVKVVGEWVTPEDIVFLESQAQEIMSGRAGRDVECPSGWYAFFRWEGRLWEPHTVYCQTSSGSAGVIFGKRAQ